MKGLLELLMLLLPVTVGLEAVVLVMRARHRDRRDRLRLLETALREGRLGGTEREALLSAVAGGPDPERADGGASRRSWFDRLAFVAGWLAVVVGGGLLATGVRGAAESGVFLLVIGLGVVALPMVLREYDERMG